MKNLSEIIIMVGCVLFGMGLGMLIGTGDPTNFITMAAAPIIVVNGLMMRKRR